MLGDKCQAFMEYKPLTWPYCVQESGWLGQIPAAASARRGRHLEGRHLERWAQKKQKVYVTRARLGEADRIDPLIHHLGDYGNMTQRAAKSL